MAAEADRTVTITSRLPVSDLPGNRGRFVRIEQQSRRGWLRVRGIARQELGDPFGRARVAARAARFARLRVCNRLGGFEPDVRHRSDDGLVLSALVASGRAVALLPALLTAAVPQIIARRLRDERLQRTIFTATRAMATDAPAVLAVRQALRDSAQQLAAEQRDLEVVS